MRDMSRKLHLRWLGLTTGLVGLVAGAGVYGTADTNLTDATSQVQTYFTDNIGTIIALVIGISLFFWLVRVAFHSVNVRKPKSVD